MVTTSTAGPCLEAERAKSLVWSPATISKKDALIFFIFSGSQAILKNGPETERNLGPA
jgi:hypothetical protein